MVTQAPAARWDRRDTLLLVVVTLFLALILGFNLGGWLMDDDEGTDFYEAWQWQQGRQPGVDYLAEQQPLFLLTGRLALSLGGHRAVALRVPTVLSLTLALALWLYAIRRRAGWGAALLATGLLVSSGFFYTQARLYRPDGLMLAWEIAALSCAVLALEQETGLRRWAAAGACYGVALLWKLFAVFPIFGVVLYFAHRWLRRPAARGESIRHGAAFVTTVALVGGGGAFLLYTLTNFSNAEALYYHATMGLAVPWAKLVEQAFFQFLRLLWENPIFVFIAPLWILQRRQRRRTELDRLLGAQLLAMVAIFVLPRPVHVRYYLFALPVLALYLSLQIQHIVSLAPPAQRKWMWVGSAGAVLLALALTTTSPLEQITAQDSDSYELAALVATETTPQELVLADYAGINFLAQRDSIYEASIIAGGQIDSGAVSWSRLQSRLEAEPVAMVLVHVAGGNPPPHQLVNLDDYAAMRAYLEEHFSLLTTFNRNDQLIEVWKRGRG